MVESKEKEKIDMGVKGLTHSAIQSPLQTRMLRSVLTLAILSKCL